jgi:hypothetical protein
MRKQFHKILENVLKHEKYPKIPILPKKFPSWIGARTIQIMCLELIKRF